MTKEWTSNPLQPARPSVFWFCVKFSGYSLLLMIIMRIDETVHADALNTAVCTYGARAVAMILRVLTGDGRADGTLVHYHGSVIGVISECIGIEVIGLFVIAVLAFPAPWPSKVRSIALGGSCLMAVNAVRLTTLVYAAAKWPSVFDVAHLYVWPLIILGIALAIWMQWAQRISLARDR